MPFLIADVAPLTLQQTGVFIKLTDSAIGLTPASIPMPEEGIKTPSDADVRTTCFDAQLLAVPARLLATFGRQVDVDVFSIKNLNLLITNCFCSKPVDKNGNEGKIIFSNHPFCVVIGAFEHRKRCPDRREVKKGFPFLFVSFWVMRILSALLFQ